MNGDEDQYACVNSQARIAGTRRKYCPHEVTALVMGVQRYADDSCPWSCILNDPELGPQFHGRTGVDLKDKWRTLTKSRPELASFTENRKNNRQYRPFDQEEEQALIEGVRRYSGERNIWSMILDDPKLGKRFNDRSNVQLKDKFRTMKRAGQIIEVPPARGSRAQISQTMSGRKPATKRTSPSKTSNQQKKTKRASASTPVVAQVVPTPPRTELASALWVAAPTSENKEVFHV